MGSDDVVDDLRMRLRNDSIVNFVVDFLNFFILVFGIFLLRSHIAIVVANLLVFFIFVVVLITCFVL